MLLRLKKTIKDKEQFEEATKWPFSRPELILNCLLLVNTFYFSNFDKRIPKELLMEICLVLHVHRVGSKSLIYLQSSKTRPEEAV